MKRTIKRRLSILLALVMLFSLLPTLSAPVSAEPATYTLVGATATSTGVTSYTVPEGKRYTTNIGSSLTPVFSDDNTPPSGDVKTSTFPLCTDESCNNNLSEDPTVGVTYYSYFHIYNSDACPDDVTIDYTHVDLSKVSISIAGYSVNVLSSTAKYVNSKPGVEIKYSVTRQAAPATSTISSVALSVTEPTAGATVPSYIVDVNNAGVSAESGANYTVVESGWLQNDGAGGSEYTTDTEFQAGKTYLLFATLSPNEGYQFSEECTGKVNGAAADDYYRRTPDLIVYKEFTIPAAETTYPVWVGDTQVNSANKDNILGDTGAPTAVYDPETHTLTLNDPTIMGEPSSASGAKIYIYDSSVTYTIDGTATIDGDIVMGNGWTADLVIKGNITAKRVVNPDHSVTVDGNLTLNSSSVFALRASSITIASGTVDVTGVDYGIEGSTVTISGGTVTAKASSSTGSAIHAYTALSIAATHEVVLPAGGVLSSDGKDVCKSDGTTIATEAKIAPKETITEYPVWVGSTQVTSANKDNILGDSASPHTAIYDPDTNTLTLANPTVSGSHEDSIIYSKDDLTVKGTATLNDPMNAYGIYSLKTVTISGSDTSIKVSSSGFGIYSKNGDVVINSGSVDAAGTGSNCAGIFAEYNITISGGTVKATGDLAVDADKISVTAGTLTAEGTTHGLRADDLTISGGTVTVTGGSFGVEAGHSVTVNGGTAEFTGNTYRAFDFDNITIADGLSVLVNHDANASGATPWNGTDHLGGNYVNDFKYVKIGSGILPTTYPVWVGGVQLTSENIDGTAIPGVKYDPSTFTLTLTDADITGAYGVVGIRSEGIDLVIEGKGNVKASGAVGIAVSKKDGSGGSLTIDADLSVSGIFGMNVENTLTIKGGELTISLSASASTAITAGAVDVQGGTVWANSSGNYAFYVSGDFKISAGDVAAQYGNYGIYAGGDVEITGGTLTVDSALYGISAGGNMEITGGMVTAKSNGSTGKGIMAENGDITISGASTKVIAEGTKKGILAGGDITISGGTVTAKGGEEGIEAGTGTITISGGTVVAEATGSSGIGIHAKGKITVSGDGTAVTGKALSGSCGVRTDGAIEVNGGSLEGKCAETGYGIYADDGISFAATHEIVIPEGGTLSESSKTIFASGGGGVAAHAKIAPKEPAYPLWVGGLQIKDSNKDAISTVTGGSAKYDPASNTLTLTGVTGFTGMYYASSPNQYYGIFYNPDSASECLNIVLEGENKFTDFSWNNILIDIDEGSAVISGSGTLTVSTGKPDMVVWCANDLTVSAALDLVADRCCLLSLGTLTISADVTASSGDMSSAISAGNVVINGGRVEAINEDIGAYNWAIEADNGITIAATHAIVLPAGGEVGATSSGYYILDSSHNKVKHVIIEPIDVAYPVWVQGIQVKDSNKDNVLGDGKVVFTPASGSTPHTLTLSGASISDTTEKPAIYTMDADLLVTGSATISVTNDRSGIRMDKDESSGGTLTLENAQLTISGGSIHDAIEAYNMSIENSTVEITGFSGGIRTNGGDLTISGSTVNAACTNFGFHVDGTLTIANDITSVHAKSTSASALSAMYGKTIVLGDQLMIKTPEGGEIGTGLGELYHGQVIFESGGTTQAKEVLIVPKEVTYPVWVGGMQVKDSNKTDILGDGTAKFDPATNTLTLDGLNVGDGLHASGASIVSTGIDLTVTGSATLTGSGYGIYVINLSGGGSLTLDKAEITYAGDSASDVGVKADGDITVKDSKLELSAKNNGVCAGGAISIDGGTVTAEATDANNGTAIEADAGIGISNADVTATTADGPFTTGVYSEAGDITISGGTVTATAGGSGVYAYGGEVKIENGTEKVEATVGTVAVRGKTGVTIGDELMIKLPEGGEVKSKSGFYEIMDGTDTARHALIVPKEATVYTVTFDANSGSGTMTPNPVTVVAGKKLTLLACTFTPPSADKEFDKWDAGKPGDEVEITSDCVIRAIWKEKTAPVTYTVTVTDDGNGTATASPASGASGDEVTLTATPKSGYKFKEWKVVSGGVTVTDNKFKIGTANVEIQAIFEKEAAPVPAVYTVVGGGDSEWTKGSGKTLTVTVKRDPNDSECFSHFASVEIGGKTLTAGTDYDAKSGSTIVTIKAAALEKLAAGKHTISILFDDGKAETKVTIKAGAAAGAKDSSPKTGQERTMIIWVPLMLVSGLGLCAVLITDKKRRPAGRH